jgi:hypothetical protein
MAAANRVSARTFTMPSDRETAKRMSSTRSSFARRG